MTISLNPLFAGSARQNVQLADETTAVDMTNPFAGLLAAQLQVSSMLPVTTAPADLPNAALVDESLLESAGRAQADILGLQPSGSQSMPTLLDAKFPALRTDADSAQQAQADGEPASAWLLGAAPVVGAAQVMGAAQGQLRPELLVGGGRNTVADDSVSLIRLAASQVDDQLVQLKGQELGALALQGSNAMAVASSDSKFSLIAPMLKENAVAKADKAIDIKLPASVKELVSMVASAQSDKPIKEMADAKVLPVIGRQLGAAEFALAGGLKDKGFAVRIEADMALSAAGKDGLVPMMLQTPTLPQSLAQTVPAASDAVIAEPMAKSDAWGAAFGKQLMSNAAAGLEQTTIQVNPEHLGPLEISITMNKEQAQVMVIAANPQARDIVEHHLPALSRMMEQAGLQLADAQVSSQQQGQNQGQEQGRRAAQQHREPVAELSAQVDDQPDLVAGGLAIKA